MHNNIELSLKPNFMSSFLLKAVFPYIYAFSSIALKSLNLHDKCPNTFALYIYYRTRTNRP